MPSLDDAFGPLIAALVNRYGQPDAASDGDDRFEMMLATFLSRSLGKAKGRAAIDRLRAADMLTPEGLAAVDPIELLDLTAGQIRVASLSVIKRLAHWTLNQSGSGRTDHDEFARSSDDIREELATIRGIGVAGADALLLHAFERPSYAVDRPTFRILARHGWLDTSASYDDARELLIGHASKLADGDDVKETLILARLSHGMSKTGREHCRVAKAMCAGCPLESLLPDGGLLEIES